MEIINIIEIGLFVLIVGLIAGIYLTPGNIPPQWKHAMKNDLISRQLKKAYYSYRDKQRFYQFWFQAERIKNDNIKGDFAELGVYRGNSARVLHLMAPERNLHLFDTFGGFPEKDLEPETGEAAGYTPKNFADCSIEGVKELIKGNENIVIHKGYFPDSAKNVKNTKFAFVNIDVDLYNPTKTGLEFFYPRLSPGGVVLIHDYNHKWPGLMKAVDEFAKTIPEVPVLLPDRNSTMLIVKNK